MLQINWKVLSTVDLGKYNNSWYKVGANSFKRTAWYFMNALILNSYYFPFSSFKLVLLRLFGAKIGSGCIIKPSVNIKYPWKLTIGDNCWIGEKVWIDNLADVVIGNNVCVSQAAYLFCGNHNYKKPHFDLIVSAININHGAWIGAYAIVCPGVSIGTNAVLSAAAIATNDMEANYIYRGNPAEKYKLRKIEA